MPAYIQGNLALDQKRSSKVKIKETTKVVYRNKTLPAQEKMLYLVLVMFCALVLGVVAWRYAAIYQMNADILKIQRQIKEIQSENSALKQEVEKLQSPGRLKQEAARLGLKPEGEQQMLSSASNKGKAVAAADNNGKTAAKR